MLRMARPCDAPAVAALAQKMWDHDADTLAAEFRDLFFSKEAAVFVFENRGAVVAFAQCQLRHDYVEGTESSPVGYLEGIYVLEGWRGRGIASQLLSACQQWAREQGCREFASDCELDNTESLAFHLALGFREANRIICFTKTL